MKNWKLEEDPAFNGEKEEKEKEKEEKEEKDEKEKERRRNHHHRSSSSSRSPSLPPLDPDRGVTVELHGNVHELVCPDCHRVRVESSGISGKRGFRF